MYVEEWFSRPKIKSVWGILKNLAEIGSGRKIFREEIMRMSGGDFSGARVIETCFPGDADGKSISDYQATHRQMKICEASREEIDFQASLLP